jgi:cellobiose-specific phosphotransferase system component IIC
MFTAMTMQINAMRDPFHFAIPFWFFSTMALVIQAFRLVRFWSGAAKTENAVTSRFVLQVLVWSTLQTMANSIVAAYVVPYLYPAVVVMPS